MNDKIFYAMIAGAIFLVGLVAGIIISPQDEQILEPVQFQQVDYSDRFDRIEAGILNSTVDICFQWGGQWITDQNNLLMQDFDIQQDDNSSASGEAIFCVRQKQEVQ